MGISSCLFNKGVSSLEEMVNFENVIIVENEIEEVSTDEEN